MYFDKCKILDRMYFLETCDVLFAYTITRRSLPQMESRGRDLVIVYAKSTSQVSKKYMWSSILHLSKYIHNNIIEYSFFVRI